MAISNKARFQLEVLEAFGVMPMFDGPAPDYVDDAKVTNERYGPWCRRVLGRKATEVTLLGKKQPDAKLSIRKLAVDEVIESFKLVLRDQRALGYAAGLAKQKKALTLAKEKVEDLERQKERLGKLSGEVTRMKKVVSDRSKVANARSQVRASHSVAAEMLEFLDEQGGGLEPLLEKAGREAAKHMEESGSVSAGFLSLFHFMNHRLLMGKIAATSAKAS